MAGNTHIVRTDPAANRAAQKYVLSEQTLRIAWAFGRWLLRLSPRPMFGWRRWVLRLFGAKIGAHVRVYSSTNIYMPWNVEIGDWSALGEDVFIYSLGHVTIGANASLAYRTHVCAGTHDFDDPTLPLLKPEVRIGEGVWIGTEAYIGPGVTLGTGALVGARAVVVKDVPAMQIVAGNPARAIGTRKRT